MIFSSKNFELGPEEYFWSIIRSLKISDAFEFWTQKISDVSNFGQNSVRNQKRLIVINVLGNYIIFTAMAFSMIQFSIGFLLIRVYCWRWNLIYVILKTMDKLTTYRSKCLLRWDLSHWTGMRNFAGIC